jgi:hypothetical protein
MAGDDPDDGRDHSETRAAGSEQRDGLSHSAARRRRKPDAAGKGSQDDHLSRWAAKYGKGVSHTEASSRPPRSLSMGEGGDEEDTGNILGGKSCPHRRAALKHVMRHHKVRLPPAH